MKKFITLCVAAVVLVAVVCGVLAGCDPNGFASGFERITTAMPKTTRKYSVLYPSFPTTASWNFWKWSIITSSTSV